MELEQRYDCLVHKEGYEKEYFWISGVAVLPIGFMGLIGNLFSIIVFLRRTFRKEVFYQLLCTLAVFDSIYVLTRVGSFGYYSMACRTHYNEAYHFLLNLLSDIGLTGSIYTTIIVSLERYLGICHPFFPYRRKICIYLIPIFAVVFCFHLPQFLDTKYYISNGTLNFTTRDWNDDKYHVSYYHWANIVVESVIPISLILLVNALIIREIWNTPSDIANTTKGIENRPQEAIKTLSIVVTIFLLARFFALITNTVIAVYETKKDTFSQHREILHSFDVIIQVFNSSVNFILYLIVHKYFRHELRLIYIACYCKIISKLK